MKRLIHLPALALLFAVPASPVAAESGQAIAHDGSSIYFEVHGSGDRFLFLGPGTAAPRVMPAAPGVPPPSKELSEMLALFKQVYIDTLSSKFRLIFIEYPGNEPKLYTLTPGAVARDYLAIADAAGAGKFAYAGFSWGCVTGLQLALRTDRMTALICGGFPVMDGIYEDMLATTRTMARGPATLYGLESDSPENGRQYQTYYEGLQRFDDRLIQGALDMPRLSWIGDQDQPTLNGKSLTHMGQLIMGTRTELEAAGWDVRIIPGKNHLDGGAPDVQATLIDEWLTAVFRSPASNAQ